MTRTTLAWLASHAEGIILHSADGRRGSTLNNWNSAASSLNLARLIGFTCRVEVRIPLSQTWLTAQQPPDGHQYICTDCSEWPVGRLAVIPYPQSKISFPNTRSPGPTFGFFRASALFFLIISTRLNSLTANSSDFMGRAICSFFLLIIR